MTAVFFRLIPRILFEPVAVAAVLGIITALIYSWKKRNNLFWFVACSVVFMIGWRLVIPLCIDPDLSGDHFRRLFLLSIGRYPETGAESSGKGEAYCSVAVYHWIVHSLHCENSSCKSVCGLYPLQLCGCETGCREVCQPCNSRGTGQ